MSGPKVSVLLPCYQAEAAVERAARSILDQTHTGLELLALDDGSTDGTRAVLDRLAAADERVRVVVNETNVGLIATLNRGLELADGEFVARMDADDVSEPGRLERQLDVFQRHPDTDAVGTGVRLLDPRGRATGRRPPRACTPGGCRFLSYLATPVAHPTLLARRQVLAGHGYRPAEEALHAEDYDLFARLVRSGATLRNVDEALLGFRVSPGSVSRRFETIQVQHFRRLARDHLRSGLGREVAPGVHAVLVNRMDPSTRVGELRAGLTLLDELEEAFLAEEPEEEVRREIRAVAVQQRVDILLQAARRGRPSVRVAAAAGVFGRPWTFLSRPGRSYLATKGGS